MATIVCNMDPCRHNRNGCLCGKDSVIMYDGKCEEFWVKGGSAYSFDSNWDQDKETLAEYFDRKYFER